MRRSNFDDFNEEDYAGVFDTHPVTPEEQDKRVPRQPKKKSSPKRTRQVVLTVVISIALIIALIYGIRAFYQSGLEAKSDSTETVIVNIPEGSSVSEVARILSDDGIIKNSLVFQSYVGRHSYGGAEIMAAEYQLSPSMTVPEIFEIMTSGEAYHGDAYEITIPEGKNISEMAAIVAESGLCTADEFTAEAGKLAYYKGLYSILSSIPEDEVASRTLEGYLFPDTYTIYVTDSDDMTPQAKLVNAMLQEFTDNFTQEMIDKATSDGRTVDDIVIMASIVELETKLPEDRKDAASVFYNRIAQDMPLQSDITVDYALGTKNAVLTTEQVESTDSPYNTYLYTGLPLGPICSPGLASIDAALNPNNTDYLYFVADMTTGKLHFNSTYEGHEQDVATYMSDDAIASVTQ